MSRHKLTPAERQERAEARAARRAERRERREGFRALRDRYREAAEKRREEAAKARTQEPTRSRGVDRVPPERPYVEPVYSDRAVARMTEEPHRAPEPHVTYNPWRGRAGLSPFARHRTPRRRDVKVNVIPQSKRRPWEYQKPKGSLEVVDATRTEQMIDAARKR
jgi:hypothetical protein